ncbi:hypothetical protein [Pseudodesulfovibrio portus]|uniref:hypothetical protein n=1 Tax=Pseudodesulfovibrio portus TaxID=231439 RepID=UPI00222F420C|nr:hypothetical protein [Pseudodesulfovibrio portus]
MADNSYYVYSKTATIIILRVDSYLQFYTYPAGIRLMAGKTGLPAFLLKTIVLLTKTVFCVFTFLIHQLKAPPTAPLVRFFQKTSGPILLSLNIHGKTL